MEKKHLEHVYEKSVLREGRCLIEGLWQDKPIVKTTAFRHKESIFMDVTILNTFGTIRVPTEDRSKDILIKRWC